MLRTKGPVLLSGVVALLVGGVLLAAPAYAAAPTISSFTPTSGPLLTKVTITGTGFASPATVSFDGVAATIVSVTSSTKITASVPSAAGTGTIAVTTAGGTATSSGTFTVSPGVLLTPTSGPPGRATSLKFSGFSAFEAADVYLDTTDTALVTTDANGTASTTLTIPASATPGTHWISVVGRHSGYAAQAAYLVRTDSPGYGFSITHRSDNAYENVLGTGSVSGLREAWRSASHGNAFNTPAIVGGVAYVGFGDGTICAFNETTGAQLWTYATGALVTSSPTVVNGVVYVGSYDHYVYALSAATGALKWRYQTGDEVYSSPAVSGGVVYVGSVDKNVYALNAATGALIWKYLTGYSVISSPAVSGGMVYVGSQDDKVYAINASTGALVWTYTTGFVVNATPAVADGMVFVGSNDDSMYALKASTGALQWSYAAGAPITAGAAVANGTVFFGSNDGKEYALNESNGAVRWTTTPSAGASAMADLDSGTTYANGVVYVSDAYRTYALTASFGGVLDTLPSGTGNGYPVVVDGTLTIADYLDGALIHYTLSADSGNTVHARPVTSRLTPTIAA